MIFWRLPASVSQILRLQKEHGGEGELEAMRQLLEALCEDEVEHRNEAIVALFGSHDAFQARFALPFYLSA
jgi:hypothetical protein